MTGIDPYFNPKPFSNPPVYEPGKSILKPEILEKIYQTASIQSYRSFGAGDSEAQYQTVLSGFDRFGKNAILANHELVGYTFITRPKLNFSTQSLRQDRILAMLDTVDPHSLHFAIRCYLDTKFANDYKFASKTTICPFFNDLSPFIIPLSNCLVNISGVPDYIVETETSDGGYFSEDQTHVIGSDRMNRTSDLTLTFRDIQGGFIFSLFLFWIRYMDMVSRGEVMAYMDDIEARRLNYTVSIYRFLLDPSRTTITKWGKFTGCFPKNVPLGSVFGFNDRDSFVSGASQLSIPWTANHFDPMDPLIFREFNSLITKYAGIPANMDATDKTRKQFKTDYSTYTVAGNTPDTNFKGIPWIDIPGQLNRFVYLLEESETQNPLSSTWTSIQQDLKNAVASSSGQTHNIKSASFPILDATAQPVNRKDGLA